MEKIGSIMNENELCLEALKHENKALKEKLAILEQVKYAGYYDETNKYVIEIDKFSLKENVKELFNADEVIIG